MTIQDFKSQHGIQSISFYKGKGRMYSKVLSATTGKTLDLFCSATCDLSKPLYVNEGKFDALWVGNNTTGVLVTSI